MPALRSQFWELSFLYGADRKQKVGVCGKPRNLEEVIDQLVVPTGKGPGHVTVTGFCGLWDPCNLYSLYSFVSPKPNLQDSCWGCVEAYPLSACRCDRYSALVGASGFTMRGGFKCETRGMACGIWKPPNINRDGLNL